MINMGTLGLWLVLLCVVTIHCTAYSIAQDDEDNSLLGDLENALREWNNELVNK